MLEKFFVRGTLACLGVVLSMQAQAFCGFFAGRADASLFNEASQVVIARDGQRTVLSLLNDYKGPLNEFALIIPTPVVLKQGQVRVAEKLVFERLDAYSSPRLAEYHDANPCQLDFHWGMPRRMEAMMMRSAPMPSAAPAAISDKALGVTVEVKYTLEEYDIVGLSATQSDGLETWLLQNGYKIPKGASAALKPYINMGMKFFVAKVNLKEQAKTGYSYLRPLQFAFESDKFMLPMRLGMLNAPPDKPQDLIIYVLTKNGRVESSNYRTMKLPANVNLPAFIKPKFKDFYAAMFDAAAKKEQHKVVFTEYFWDMAWCDPCADNPLSTQELLKAGAFWVIGDDADGFNRIQNGLGFGASQGQVPNAAGNNTSRPARTANPQIAGQGQVQIAPMPVPPSGPMPPGIMLPPFPGGGAQPAVLTRLHVRYTPQSFAEDLMFTQTKDRQNWQTRYVVQNPYKGTVEQCQADTAQQDCLAMCKPRVAQMSGQPTYGPNGERGAPRSESDLQAECMKACQASKQNAVSAAINYYQRDLPKRIAAEKQTLAQLTGWGMAEIDKLPGATQFPAVSSGSSTKPVEVKPAPETSSLPSSATVPSQPSWWQRLFERAKE